MSICDNCKTGMAIRASFKLGSRFAWDEAEKRLAALESRQMEKLDSYMNQIDEKNPNSLVLLKKVQMVNKHLMAEISRIDSKDIDREMYIPLPIALVRKLIANRHTDDKLREYLTKATRKRLQAGYNLPKSIMKLLQNHI